MGASPASLAPSRCAPLARCAPLRQCACEDEPEVFTKAGRHDRGSTEEANTQHHVFQFYEELTEEEKEALDDDFDEINLEQLRESFVSAMDQLDLSDDIHLYEPPRLLNWAMKKPPVITAGANVTVTSQVSDRKLLEWTNAGFTKLCAAQVALVMLAGGDSDHLHVSAPLPLIDIGLSSKKSILQVVAERVRRLEHLIFRRTKRVASIPVYVMVNKANAGRFEKYLQENEFFGLREQDVQIFVQNQCPLVDKDGQLILDQKYRIAHQPNGNGGLFRALMDDGMLQDMKSRGVAQLHVFACDNLSTKVGDPLFLGFNTICEAQGGIKVVERLSPDELVGALSTKRDCTKEEEALLAKRGQAPRLRAGVIEWHEMPEDAKRRKDREQLRFAFANTCQYCFNVDVIKSIAESTQPWHAVEDVIPHVDLATGVRVVPALPNAYRLSLFAADGFDVVNRVVGLQVAASEFAPIKDLVGERSAGGAIARLAILHQGWITEAGGRFCEDNVASEKPSMRCEVSPLVSYWGEDLGGQFREAVSLPLMVMSLQESQGQAVDGGLHREMSLHCLDTGTPEARALEEAEVMLTARQIGSARGSARGAQAAVETEQKAEGQGETQLHFVGAKALMHEEMPATPRDDAGRTPWEILEEQERAAALGEQHQDADQDEGPQAQQQEEEANGDEVSQESLPAWEKARIAGKLRGVLTGAHPLLPAPGKPPAAP
mmetsp:Transcript_37449/g.85741  ORF Transcript_37449/g.85741 Transcript_37449/m.85741 type:complete len:717 (+) Transcript_37449:23-2173(+)